MRLPEDDELRMRDVLMPEENQILLEVARWIATHRNARSAIRALAGTEETYLLLIRELDRVEQQHFRAQRLHAEATLTLVEWLETLHHFHWLCAYCQSKPFKVMSHYMPLPQGGTTVANCVPACYRCRRYREKEPGRVHAYLRQFQACKDLVGTGSSSVKR